MQNKKHILILTTWFPPISGVAVNRMLAFAKYLDKNQFNVTVVTLKSENSKNYERDYDCEIYRVENKLRFKLPTFKSEDTNLKHKLKVLKKTIILKIQKSELFNWQISAYKKIVEIHKSQKIDLILSSFSPAEPHIVASKVVSQFNEIKWIADMRDEMSENNSVSKSKKKFLQSVEKNINENASAIITVSKPIVEYLKITFPNVKTIKEIRNGFDHDLKLNQNYFNSTFTFVYAGSFYGKRKPNTFFQALLNCKKHLPEKWKIQFVGTARNFNVPKEFVNNIEFIPRVKQEKSIEYMLKSDANVIIHPAENRKGIFTGKLFDYASVGRPILAIIDENDVAADLINNLNLGFVANFDDIDKIELGIIEILNLWKNKKVLNIDESKIKKLHRKYQVEKVSMLINQLIKNND